VAGRRKQTVARFFTALGPQRAAALTHVSADGADWIGDVVAEYAPQALHCLDAFHAVGWVTDALDEVRRQVWNQLRGGKGQSTPESKAFKGARWALWKNPDRLNERQQATLASIQATNRPLYRAYLGADRSTPGTGNRLVNLLSAVGEEAVDGGFAVGVGGQAVRPGGFEPRMSHEFGDQDEVVAFADQAGAEGVAQDVPAGEVGGDGGLVGDGEQDVVGAAVGEPAAALVEQQRRAVGAGPAGPLVVDPEFQVFVQAGVHGDFPVLAVLAGPHGDQALGRAVYFWNVVFRTLPRRLRSAGTCLSSVSRDNHREPGE
jgi:hypothetical protein